MKVDEMRRWNDHDSMKRFQSNVVTWSVEDIDTEENLAPRIYQVHYDLRSIVGWNKDEEPIYHTGFDVVIDLGPPYPLQPCEVRFVGQISLKGMEEFDWVLSARSRRRDSIGQWPWHPSIHPDKGLTDIGHVWLRGIGLTVDEVVETVGEIIAFRVVDERTTWVASDAYWDHFRRNLSLFPTDRRSIRRPGWKERIRFGQVTSAKQ